MGIFKNITKSLKKAAPLIGSAIGMYIGGPAGYAALGGALGGGIGSLVGGGDTDDALKAAALGGIGGYLASGSFAGTAVPPGREVVGAVNRGGGTTGGYSGFNQVKGFESVPIKEPGIMSKIGTFAKENPLTTAGIAGLGLSALGGEEKPTMGQRRPDPVGKSRLGVGLIGDKAYNLDDEDDRKRYFEDLRKQQGVTPTKFASEGLFNRLSTPTLYYLRNKSDDFSEMEQRQINNIYEKRMGSESDGFSFLPTDKLRQIQTLKEGYTEQELGDVRNILKSREETKTPIFPMMNVDPSQLMRTFMGGGEVEGPGTGTSDSVPARLSDGEFVLTAKAVRGAGGGDRDLGAARMYDMMSKLERVA